MKVFSQNVNLKGLRRCQKEAYERLVEYFSQDSALNHVLIQLPTGTGKSALIATIPFKIAKKKVLVLVPSVELSKQLLKDFDIIDYPNDNAYKKYAILSSSALETIELYPLRLESAVNSSDVDEHDIIIANYHQLADVEKFFKGREELIDLIIIDEAHHQKAKTYQRIINFFREAKIIGLTGTPFRSDGQKVDGKKIYTYHFHEAIKDKIIRNIKVSNISPKEIELSFNDQKGGTYTLEDIIKLKEDAWFCRGIALSEDCCNTIASKAKDKLDELRENFPKTDHQIIAVAISIRHAREFVKPSFERLGLSVGLVSSHKKEKQKNDKTLKNLRQGKIDVIVHVGMLGEGFDHNKLGVAAIFRPFKSLNPYVQFVGRVIRKNGNSKDCWVVSHMGLNQTRRFEEFKMFDQEDQQFIKMLDENNQEPSVDEEKSFVEDDNCTTDSSSTNDAKIREIGNEQIDFSSTYIKDETLQIKKIKKAVNKLSEEGKKEIYNNLNLDFDNVSSDKKKKTKPINERKASRSLLNEKEKSITNDILKELGVKYSGRDFNKRYNNFAWIKRKVSSEINKKIGITQKKRKEITNNQFKEIEDEEIIEQIKKDCLKYFKNKIKNKNPLNSYRG
ncbi:MAG: DEAD/DEAH box helicase [Patescibacteria group bacterium]